MQTMKQWKYCCLNFFIIFGLLIVKFMFHCYFERKNDKVSTFNIVHFPNFEINASLRISVGSNIQKL